MCPSDPSCRPLSIMLQTPRAHRSRWADDCSIFQPLNVHCIPIVIDLVSLNLLKGATLHYATELIGSSFRIQDNPQAKEGGACGCGVSWEAA